MIEIRNERCQEDIPKKFTWNPPFSYEVRCLCSLFRWVLGRICSVWFLFSFYFCFIAILFSHLLIFINFFIVSNGVYAKFAQNQELVFQYSIDFTRNWLEEAPQMLDIYGDWLVLNSNEGKLGDPRMVDDINDTYIPRRVGYFTYSMIEGTGNAFLFSTPKADFVVVNPPNVGDDPFYKVGYLVANDTPEVCCPYEDENQTFPDLVVDYISEDDFSLQRRSLTHLLYEPRAIPWYSTPSNSPNVTNFFWNNYLTVHGVITSSVSRNVMKNTDTNERLGVVGSSLFLSRWELIISSLRIEPGIILFVDQSDDGLLLSSSDPATEVCRIDESTGKLTRVKVEETNHTVVRDAAEFMKSEISETNSVTDVLSFERETFYSEGEKWHIRAQRVEITGNFRILVVYLIRDMDVFYDVYRSNYLSFVTSYMLMAFFLFFFLIVIMCLCFYCPLNMFSREMKKVEKMDTESINLTCTSFIYFHEIRTLRRRFEVCVVELEKMKSFLPSGLVDDKNEKKKKKNDEENDLKNLNERRYGSEIVYFGGSSDENLTDRQEIMCDDGIPEVRGIDETFDFSCFNGNNSNDSNNNSEKDEDKDKGNHSNHKSDSDSSMTKYTRKLSLVRQKRRFKRRRRTFPPEDLPFELYEREVLGVYISIINWKELILSPNDNKKKKKKKDENYYLSRYLKMYSEFLNFAMRYFQGGRIVSFGIDHVTLAFVYGEEVVNGVKRTRKFAKKFERKKREVFLENTRRQYHQHQHLTKHHFSQYFKLFVSVGLENTIVGDVGSSQTKRLVHLDGAIERAIFINERFTEFVIPLINEIKSARKRNTTTTTTEEEDVSIEKEGKSLHVFCDSNVKDLIAIRKLKLQTYPIDVCLHHFGKESESRPSRTGYISSINCEKVIIYQVEVFNNKNDKNGKKIDKYRLMTVIFDVCQNQDFHISWHLLRNLLGQGLDFDEELKKIEISTISDFLEVCKIRFMKKIVVFVKEKNIDLESEEEEEECGEGEESTSSTSLDIFSDEDHSTDIPTSTVSTDGDNIHSTCYTNFEEMLDQHAWEMEKSGYLFEFLSVLFQDRNYE